MNLLKNLIRLPLPFSPFLSLTHWLPEQPLTLPLILILILSQPRYTLCAAFTLGLVITVFKYPHPLPLPAIVPHIPDTSALHHVTPIVYCLKFVGTLDFKVFATMPE